MKKETRDTEDESSQSQSDSASQRSGKNFDEFSGISIKVRVVSFLTLHNSPFLWLASFNSPEIK